jgi:hypothetical protein
VLGLTNGQDKDFRRSNKPGEPAVEALIAAMANQSCSDILQAVKLTQLGRVQLAIALVNRQPW